MVMGAIAAGASIGIVLEKSLIASLQRPLLDRKARNLHNWIVTLPKSPRNEILLRRLHFEINLWKKRIISNREFKSQLEELIGHFKDGRWRI